MRSDRNPHDRILVLRGPCDPPSVTAESCAWHAKGARCDWLTGPETPAGQTKRLACSVWYFEDTGVMGSFFEVSFLTFTC